MPSGNNNEFGGSPPPYANPGEQPFPQGSVASQYPYPDQGMQSGPPPSGLPVDRIVAMRRQGLSNNQIVQSLQRDGFDSGQIFDAMNQADLQSGAPMDMGMPQAMPPFEPPHHQFSSPLPPPDGMPPPFSGSIGSPDVQKVEEIAEAIIDEKWEEMIKSINRIMEWKDATENRMARIEQQFADLKDNFDNLHAAIVGKVGEYDKNIMNVGTEIKAMEKVFQKILPTFTENVSELSRITRNLGTRAVPRKPLK